MDALDIQFAFFTHSASETRYLGESIGALLQAPVVLALHGDLGAGKTTLIQGIAAGLGLRQRVTSPTFTLVNEYPLPKDWRLFHIDSYRLDAGEAETIGLDEILDDEQAIIIIEWAERVANLLPSERVDIQLTTEQDAQSRKIVVSASANLTHFVQTLQEGMTR